MDGNAPDRPWRVGFLLIDGFALMSYAAAREPLRVANLLAGQELYRVRDVTLTDAPTRASAGMIVHSDALMGDAFDYDLVLVVAGGDPFSVAIDRLAPWLRGLDRRGALLGGVSGGPVLLARAGLMENRRLTLHWEHERTLAETHPDLVLERSLFVIDRDRLSCAGGTAPLDLMHALIAQQHGSLFARRVSDWLIHTEVRRSGGAQRAGAAERYGVSHPGLLAVVEAMEAALSRTQTLRQWARHAGVGERQLDRLFRQHLQATPLAFHRNLRLDKAAALLATTSLSVSEIALATGFSNFSHFGTTFARRFGTSPVAFRDGKRRSSGGGPRNDRM